MRTINLNVDNGHNVMLGNYYRYPALCLDECTKNNIGSQLAEALTLNIPAVCSYTQEALEQSGLDKSLGISLPSEFQQACFESGKVKFDKENKYFKFPYYKHRDLSCLTIGIDINPCFMHSNKMTKVYSVFRYDDHTTEFENTINLLRDAIKMCNILNVAIMNIFLTAIKEILNYNSENQHEEFKVVSVGIGLTDPFIKEYVDISNDRDKFYAFCLNENKAISVGKYLGAMCSLSTDHPNRQNSLTSYSWSKWTRYLNKETGQKQEEKTPAEVFSYIGVRAEPTTATIVALSPERPEFTLRPINIDIINTY